MDLHGLERDCMGTRSREVKMLNYIGIFQPVQCIDKMKMMMMMCVLVSLGKFSHHRSFWQAGSL